MPAPNRRKKRRGDAMNFAYAGPFAPLLNPIRTLPLTKERYTPDSAERYDIASAIGEALTRELGVRFGSNAVVTNRPKRRRRRGGVAA